MTEEATRWHYRAIKREICTGISFPPRRRRKDEERGTAPCKRGQVFRAASNTATIPSVDGLTWLTLINISKISNESPSGSRGEHMPLQLDFASVIFLLVRCCFSPSRTTPTPPPHTHTFYSEVCAHACAALFGVCVADQPAVPWLGGGDISCHSVF